MYPFTEKPKKPDKIKELEKEVQDLKAGMRGLIKTIENFIEESNQDYFKLRRQVLSIKRKDSIKGKKKK